MLDDFLCLTLDDGSKFTVKFLEWKLLALFYESESIYTDIGKEFCIALDVALGSSGCETFVSFCRNNVKCKMELFMKIVHT